MMNKRLTDMATAQRASLSHYLELSYPYTVINDDGSFFIEFPDLPGCMTQVENASDIAAMADEIRTLWLETEYERGADIPEPASHAGYSGRFVMRVPKTLHRNLAQSAKQEGMSLNAYVLYLLSERQSAAKIGSQLDDLRSRMESTGRQNIPLTEDVDEKRPVSITRS
jgi:predicted RNase H-like HicB family nuclease